MPACWGRMWDVGVEGAALGLRRLLLHRVAGGCWGLGHQKHFQLSTCRYRPGEPAPEGFICGEGSCDAAAGSSRSRYLCLCKDLLT